MFGDRIDVPSMMKHDSSKDDPGLRRMIIWVIVALVATVALAILVVELTMRWFNR
jgi:hypothetical protein